MSKKKRRSTFTLSKFFIIFAFALSLACFVAFVLSLWPRYHYDYREVLWAQDGGSIIVNMERYDISDLDFPNFVLDHDIYSFDIAANRRKNFTRQHDFTRIENLQFSTNGDQLAFVGYPSNTDTAHLYTLEIDTGDITEIESFDISNTSCCVIAWLPDNETIAYILEQSEHAYIYTVTLTEFDSSEQRIQINQTDVRHLQWSLNGESLYMFQDKEIVELNLTTNITTPIYQYGGEDRVRSFFLSPDNKHVLIMTDNNPVLFDLIQETEIILSPRSDFPSYPFITFISWSPESNYFALITKQGLSASIGQAGIYNLSGELVGQTSVQGKTTDIYWANDAIQIVDMAYESLYQPNIVFPGFHSFSFSY